MSLRSALITEIQENLDDSSSDRWSLDRIRRILKRARSDIYSRMTATKPGRFFRASEDIAMVSGTREYLLSASCLSVLRVDRVAIGGAALFVPYPLRRVDFREAPDYDTTYPIVGSSDWVFYVTTDIQASATVGPRIKIGFAPIPWTTGTDARVYETRGPSSSWATGGTDDANDSGLPERWESVLVLLSTIRAIRQRPPTQGVSLQSWIDDYRDHLRLAEKEPEMSEDEPRLVRDVEGT